MKITADSYIKKRPMVPIGQDIERLGKSLVKLGKRTQIGELSPKLVQDYIGEYREYLEEITEKV